MYFGYNFVCDLWSGIDLITLKHWCIQKVFAGINVDECGITF